MTMANLKEEQERLRYTDKRVEQKLAQYREEIKRLRERLANAE